MASCWDWYVVSVTVGCSGKTIVKRSSRLANSTSWANNDPETNRTKPEKTRAVEMNGIRRMLFLLRRGLTSGGSTSFGAALVAVNFVAVGACIVQFFADIYEGFIVPRLRCLASELSYFYESGNVLLPVGAIHGNGLAVLTSASRRQK